MNTLTKNEDIEYVPIQEDTPPIAKGYKNISKDVQIITKYNETHVAFLDYNKLQWHDTKTLKIVRNVVAWKDI